MLLKPTAVIPGRRKAANPESRDPAGLFAGLWIPGSLAALAPRNDGGMNLAI